MTSKTKLIPQVENGEKKHFKIPPFRAQNCWPVNSPGLNPIKSLQSNEEAAVEAAGTGSRGSFSRCGR